MFAVKRVDAIKAELVTKEVEVLQRAARTCCHANVVQYYGKEEHDDFVYIHMELCDYERAPGGALAACDLAARVGRLAPAEASRAVGELFSGLAYLHRNNIVHRDLKPTNILFKEGVLKICDMGQSRILRGGASVAQTESRGGTEGWRSPEELAAEKLQGDGGVFESRLSGDIHTAGSLAFYILTGGRHAFGATTWEQRNNIVQGRHDARRLRGRGEPWPTAVGSLARPPCLCRTENSQWNMQGRTE